MNTKIPAVHPSFSGRGWRYMRQLKASDRRSSSPQRSGGRIEITGAVSRSCLVSIHALRAHSTGAFLLNPVLSCRTWGMRAGYTASGSASIGGMPSPVISR
jgi:hypothetical protein